MLVRICPKCQHELGLYDNYFCSECGLKLPKELILDPDIIHTHVADMPKHSWIKDYKERLTHFYQTVSSVLNWREVIPLLGLLGSGVLLLISIFRSYLYTSLRVNSYLLPSPSDTLIVSNTSNMSNNMYPRLSSLSSLPVVDLSSLVAFVPKDVSLYIASSDPDKFLDTMSFLDSLLPEDAKDTLNTYVSQGNFDRFALFVSPKVVEVSQDISNETLDTPNKSDKLDELYTSSNEENIPASDEGDQNTDVENLSTLSESFSMYDWGLVLVDSNDTSNIALLASSKEYKDTIEAVLRQEAPSLANDPSFLVAKGPNSTTTKQRGKVLIYVSDNISDKVSDDSNATLSGKALLNEFLDNYGDRVPQDIAHIIKVFNSSLERYKIIL